MPKTKKKPLRKAGLLLFRQNLKHENKIAHEYDKC